MSPTRGGGQPHPLVVWFATRAAVAVLTGWGAWSVATVRQWQVPSFLSQWSHWDAQLFVKIARWGYFGAPAHYPDRGLYAFFPGEPALLWLGHALVRNWTLAGLVVSAAAGAVAVVALARVAELDRGGSAGVGSRSVLYLTLSPFAVFLFAGYSEALFLALALPAWLAARERRWAVAGLLGAAAATVRVTGVFLGLGLVVEFVLARPRSWRSAPWLAGPFLATAGYLGWVWARTGDVLAWPHAQAQVWHRGFASPWQAWRTTWHAAGNPLQGPAYGLSFRVEIAAVVVGVLLAVSLAYTRRWSEFAYVAPQVLAFATSSFYLSVGRATLLWWPLWTMLARVSLRRRWVHVAYLATAPAVMAAYVIAFTRGHWVG